MKFELHVLGWISYHWAADKVDGRLRHPDRRTTREAIDAGFRAMADTVGEERVPEVKRNHKAKTEALRRLRLIQNPEKQINRNADD